MSSRIEVSPKELRRTAAEIRSGSEYGRELVARLSHRKVYPSKGLVRKRSRRRFN